MSHGRSTSDDRVSRELASYDKNLAEYQEVLNVLKVTVPNALNDAGLTKFRVEARVKDRDSFETKVREKPERPVEDIIGIRVLLFFRSDVQWAEQIIWTVLKLSTGSYVDKSDLLANGSFGYRSVQFIGKTKPGDDSSSLNRFEDLTWRGTDVEVQIRTMVEHAWAEVEHDIRYKKTGEKPGAEISRRLALTAALLEQADENLDSMRDEVVSPRLDPIPSRAAEISGWDVERFVQSDRESLDLDRRLVSALDLETRHLYKAWREARRVSMLAGWESYAKLQAGVRQHGQIGLRLAIVCADTSHDLVMTDYATPGETAFAFKGIGLYWAALAAAFGFHDVDPFQEQPVAVPPGRLAEYAVVARFLVAHPHIAAPTVRDRYRAQAAPAGTTDSRLFAPIVL